MALGREWVRVWGQASRGRPLLMDHPKGRAWDGQDLLDVTSRVVGNLRARGIKPGSRVALALPPSADAVAAFAGVLRAGACAVAMDPSEPARSAMDGLECASADAVVHRPGCPMGVSPVQEIDLADLLAADSGQGHRDEEWIDAAHPDDLALICFTSGTTGGRKAVPMTGGQLLAGCRALMTAWRWTPEDVLVCALPLFHVHGLVVAAATSLLSGGTLVALRKFTPADVVAAASANRATMFFGVPTMWWRLAEEGFVPRLAGLRLAVSGSAPLAPELFARLEAGLGQAPVERYGMTETLILTSNPVDGVRKPGSVGLPLPGVGLRLADDGVVEASGPTITHGYLNRPPGEGFTADGWWRTGDIGEFDEDGYLFLHGRASDVIITGGHNVHPAEVEAALGSVEGVRELAVVGRRDDRWGEVVVGFVVVADGFDQGSVVRRLDERAHASLGSHQRPRGWVTVEKLPRNRMGKVLRSRLADAVVPGAASPGHDRGKR